MTFKKRAALLSVTALSMSAVAAGPAASPASAYCAPQIQESGSQACAPNTVCELSDRLAEKSAIWAKYVRIYCLY